MPEDGIRTRGTADADLFERIFSVLAKVDEQFVSPRRRQLVDVDNMRSRFVDGVRMMAVSMRTALPVTNRLMFVGRAYSTVTDFARFLGLSTSVPFASAV